MDIEKFNSSSYFEKLKGAGFTEEQARIQVEAMRELSSRYDEKYKADLHKTELRLQKEIGEVKLGLEKQIEDVRDKLHKHIMDEIQDRIEQTKIETQKIKNNTLKLEIGIVVFLALCLAKAFNII